MILAGGSNCNEARLFDRNNFDKCACILYEISREINSVDFSNRGDKFALGTSEGFVRIY